MQHIVIEPVEIRYQVQKERADQETCGCNLDVLFHRTLRPILESRQSSSAGRLNDSWKHTLYEAKFVQRLFDLIAFFVSDVNGGGLEWSQGGIS